MIPDIMELLWKLMSRVCRTMQRGLLESKLAMIHSSSGLKQSVYGAPLTWLKTLILIRDVEKCVTMQILIRWLVRNCYTSASHFRLILMKLLSKLCATSIFATSGSDPPWIQESTFWFLVGSYSLWNLSKGATASSLNSRSQNLLTEHSKNLIPESLKVSIIGCCLSKS